MSTAQNTPVKRAYNRREMHSEDIPLTHRDDIDLDKPLIHTESLPDIGDPAKKQWLDDLAFNEEPITILIEENSRSDFPETHVPSAVNGKGAEVFQNGQWLEVTWLPINVPIITKRKYVEQLLRSKSETVRTSHEDATVERPRNTVSRRNSANYPVSVLEDKSPRGAQWLVKVRTEH